MNIQLLPTDQPCLVELSLPMDKHATKMLRVGCLGHDPVTPNSKVAPPRQVAVHGKLKPQSKTHPALSQSSGSSSPEVVPKDKLI